MGGKEKIRKLSYPGSHTRQTKKGETSRGKVDPEQLFRENEILRRRMAILELEAQRSKATLYSIGDAVITTDTGGIIEQMNHVAEQLTGWPEAEALGQPAGVVFRIMNEETGAEVENPITRVLRDGAVVGLANHTLLIARDGTRRPIADSGAPIHDENGKVTGVVMVFRDQTEERAAQRVLQESERKFRDAIVYLDEAYYSCRPDGLLKDHNVAFNRILGFKPDEDLRGSMLPDFWQNPDDRKEYLKELTAKGYIRNYLINAKTIGGKKLVVMANSHLVKDENNKPVGIEGIFADFTERKEKEAELAAARQLYQELFENVNIGILRTTPGLEGTFIDINPAMVRMFEAGNREQLMALHPSEIYWDESQRKIISDAIVANQVQDPKGKAYLVLHNSSQKDRREWSGLF
jgi:PAS domain S-box-containing protein